MRVSQYLLTKIENLEQVIAFFSKSKWRRLVFLLQIDFWDWEMDEVIYSYDNFEKRKESWSIPPDSLEATLRKLRYICDFDTLKQLAGANELFAKMSAEDGQTDTVVPPAEQMERLLQKWNDLLMLVQDTILDRKRAKQVNLSGGHAVTNLRKYAKSPDVQADK